MGYNLTPEERRIIERTKREGEELYAVETSAQKKRRTWKSILVWIAVMFLFAVIAGLIYYIGTFL